MPKYEFDIWYKIERCLDCPFYSMDDRGYNKEHICNATGEEFISEGFGYKDEYKDMGAREAFENCRAELFKQCPLKLIEG